MEDDDFPAGDQETHDNLMDLQEKRQVSQPELQGHSSTAQKPLKSHFADDFFTIDRHELTTKKQSSCESDLELKWIDNIELFELLDANGLESIGFREFSAFVFLLAAYHSNQLL
jgi:hypothetical protein